MGQNQMGPFFPRGLIPHIIVVLICTPRPPRTCRHKDGADGTGGSAYTGHFLAEDARDSEDMGLVDVDFLSR